VITPRSTRPRHASDALRHAFALLLAFVSPAAPAPSSLGHDGVGAIVGRVHCPEARNAWVIVIGESFGAEVGADGFFRLTGLPAGRHTLLIRGYYCDDVQRTITVRAGVVDSIDVAITCSNIPCPNPDKADPGCIARNPEEQARVGTRCEVHPRERLRLDVVPIQYNIVGCGEPSDPRRFPNARLCWSGGCVVRPQRWTEVAYCKQCRAAFYQANPYYVLHPIRVKDR